MEQRGSVGRSRLMAEAWNDTTEPPEQGLCNWEWTFGSYPWGQAQPGKDRSEELHVGPKTLPGNFDFVHDLWFQMLFPIKHLISQGDGNLLPIPKKVIARRHVDYFLSIKVEGKIILHHAEIPPSLLVPYSHLKTQRWDGSPAPKSFLCPLSVSTHLHISRFLSWGLIARLNWIQNITVDTHSILYT